MPLVPQGGLGQARAAQKPVGWPVVSLSSSCWPMSPAPDSDHLGSSRASTDPWLAHLRHGSLLVTCCSHHRLAVAASGLVKWDC